MAKDTPVKKDGGGTDEEKALAAKKRKKMIFIISGAVLLILLSVGVTMTLLSLFSGDEKSPEAGEVAEGGAEGAADSTKLPAIYFNLHPAFVVNFEEKGRSRYLQADITLVVRDPEVIKVMEMHMPVVRNLLVILLSSQSFDALQTPEGKEALLAEALVKLQEFLQAEMGKPGVEKVLFVNFVMQ